MHNTLMKKNILRTLTAICLMLFICISLCMCSSSDGDEDNAEKVTKKTELTSSEEPPVDPSLEDDTEKYPGTVRDAATALQGKADVIADVLESDDYAEYKEQAGDVIPLTPEEYQSSLTPPYTEPLVYDAPFCKEPGDVFLQGEVTPLYPQEDVTNRYTAMQALRNDSNRVFTCVYKTYDDRKWYFYPDGHAQRLLSGENAYRRVHVYGKIDEPTGLLKVKSFITSGRHFQWDEDTGQMAAPELETEVTQPLDQQNDDMMGDDMMYEMNEDPMSMPPPPEGN